MINTVVNDASEWFSIVVWLGIMMPQRDVKPKGPVGMIPMGFPWNFMVFPGWWWLEPWNFMTFHILGLMDYSGFLDFNGFFHILGRIIPTDFHMFQRGRYTTKPVSNFEASKWWISRRYPNHRTWAHELRGEFCLPCMFYRFLSVGVDTVHNYILYIKLFMIILK